MGRRRNARGQAAAALAAVLERGESVEAHVERLRPALSSRDLRLFRELLSGSLRWLAFLDSVLERAADRPLAEIDAVLRDHLRIGAYQLLFLDRVPARAAVHEAVELAKGAAATGSRAGAARFVNAVLRLVARRPERADWTQRSDDPVADLAVNHSHPPNLVRSWVERFGVEATERLLETNNRPKRGLGVMGAQREQLSERLHAAGAEVELSALSPLGLSASDIEPQRVVAAGGYIQDEASQAAALVPPPRPFERVFDAAAAPGGKSLALVAAQADVEVVAADVRPDRLRRLADNVERMRADGIRLLVADALAPPFRNRSFDRVLFDAPCSGSGTLRKHPELKWRITPDEIGRLRQLQVAGLQALAPLVADGGRLCYVTCSIEREENEDVAAAFLDTNPDWRLERLELAPGLAEHLTPTMAWQVLPDGEHDGATVHVLRRC